MTCNNLNKFDRLASTWDDKPSRVAMAKRFGEAISESLELKSDFKLVDYGCGTGNCAIFLSESVGRVTGVDVSAPMLERFREKTKDFGDKFELVCANLQDEHINFNNPDVIISTMAFHHLDHPQSIAKHFFEELKSGGYVALIDLDSEDGSFHDDGNEGVKHFGFCREFFKDMLEKSGFTDIKDKTVHTIRKNDKEYSIFLITAKKP